MEVLGKSPIPLPLLVLGKITLGLCLFFPLARPLVADALLFQTTLTDLLGLILFAFGVLIAAAGILGLGRSITVGLPTADISLKTHGPYRFSRNPVYLGAYVTCLGSFLYVSHPVNLLLSLITVGLHHWIVLNEEKFLRKKFGEEWQRYRQRVNRYFG